MTLEPVRIVKKIRKNKLMELVNLFELKIKF